MSLEKHADSECLHSKSPDKRVGLYYTRFRKARFKPQAHLHDSGPQKNPFLRVQLRKIG